jgi:DnaJ domain
MESEPSTVEPISDFLNLPVIPEGATKYEILGVPNDVSFEKLKLAYRRLALLYHPDRHVDANRDLAGEVFKRITVAYHTLSDPQERRRYDVCLQQNEEFHERTVDVGQVTLADIIADIDAYEHIFLNEDLPSIDATLKEIISQALIQELSEQVVGIWPMLSAPVGSSHKGSYQKGTVVLTNLRVLLPFTFTWQEHSGNTRYTYKGASMPVVALPSVKHFTILYQGRVRRTTVVQIEHVSGTTLFKPGKQNLCKLLLIARLWGIAVDARQDDARRPELRWAAISPWKWAVGITLAVFVIAAILGLFGAGGFIDNPTGMAVFFSEKGIWQWLVCIIAGISGFRIWRWTLVYGRGNPSDYLVADVADKTSVSAVA